LPFEPILLPENKNRLVGALISGQRPNQKPKIYIAPEVIRSYIRTAFAEEKPEFISMVTKIYVSSTTWHEYLHEVLKLPNVIPARLKMASLKAIRDLTLAIIARVPLDLGFGLTPKIKAEPFTQTSLLNAISQTSPLTKDEFEQYQIVQLCNKAITHSIETKRPKFSHPVTVGLMGIDLDEIIIEHLTSLLLRQYISTFRRYTRKGRGLLIEEFTHSDGGQFEAILRFFNRSPQQLTQALREGRFFQAICNQLSDDALVDFAKGLADFPFSENKNGLLVSALRGKRTAERRKKRKKKKKR